MPARTASVPALAVAVLLTVLASPLLAAEPEEAEPKPELKDEIRFRSPDGKYGLRITYDRALNDLMTGKNPESNDGIFSETMSKIAIVSVPEGEVMHDMSDDVFSGGNHFDGLKLLWSADSKWCAFYFAFPRVGYTSVFHLAGDKFKLAHKPNGLNMPSKGSVRYERIEPVRWVKPGELELSLERIYRGEDPDDDSAGFTASFDGKGKWKMLKKAP